LRNVTQNMAFRTLIGVTLALATSQALSQPAESPAEQDPLIIGAIDFYGLRTIPVTEVRRLLPFSEGDERIPGFLSEDLKAGIAEALDVSRVELAGVCCMNDGTAIVFVGIEESPAEQVAYLTPPTADIELPEELLQTAREYDEAIWSAVRTGDAEEDASAGHSLAHNMQARALQERFIGYAATHWQTLAEVLHTSSHSTHRAVAAEIIAYGADKAAVASHLEPAILDSDVGVRNNATRALAIIAQYANEHPELEIGIRADAFIDMLNSIEWLDRNKGAAMLSILTQSRDPTLMAALEARALPALIEMCDWQSFGHAYPSCLMLERVLGLPEQDEPHPKDRTIALARELSQ